MLSKRQIAVIWIGVLLLVLAAGCKKKVPPPPPPPPPAPIEKPAPPPPAKAPAISQFTAEPSTIERGQSATLRWSVTDATEISIDQGIGTVQANGSRRVFPSDSTTYTLTARGPGGGPVTGTATVNVTNPAPATPPAPKAPAQTIQQRLESQVQDAFFDYDRSDIREDARNTLTRDADALKQILVDFSNAVIVIEGHCDDRGSAEYNLGLGDRRATAARDFLIQLGVPGDRLKTISYGKERPQCTDANEDCWQRNRRAHFAAGQ